MGHPTRSMADETALMVDEPRFIADRSRSIVDGPRRDEYRRRSLVEGPLAVLDDPGCIDPRTVATDKPDDSVGPMGGGIDGAAAARELLASDERLRKKIFLFAYGKTKELNAAKDLAHEAMIRVIDPERSPWDPAAQPSLLNHAGSVMNSLVASQRRGERRHPFVSHDPKLDRRVDGAPSPEARLLEVEDYAETMAQLRFWMDELRARLEGDALALGKIALVYEGIDDADEQAERLGCTRRDVYRANERIAYHANLVKRAGHKPPPRDTRGFVALAAPSEGSESEP